MKYSEALLLDTCVDQVGQRALRDSFVTTPHSIKASFLECCGSDFVYTPLFHEKTIQDVSQMHPQI